MAGELWGCSSTADVSWDHHKVGYFVRVNPCHGRIGPRFPAGIFGSPVDTDRADERLENNLQFLLAWGQDHQGREAHSRV